MEADWRRRRRPDTESSTSSASLLVTLCLFPSFLFIPFIYVHTFSFSPISRYTHLRTHGPVKRAATDWGRGKNNEKETDQTVYHRTIWETKQENKSGKSSWQVRHLVAIKKKTLISCWVAISPSSENFETFPYTQLRFQKCILRVFHHRSGQQNTKEIHQNKQSRLKRRHRNKDLFSAINYILRKEEKIIINETLKKKKKKKIEEE